MDSRVRPARMRQHGRSGGNRRQTSDGPIRQNRSSRPVAHGHGYPGPPV